MDEAFWSFLALQPFQLLFHLGSTYLRIASRSLNRRCSFHRHMPKIVSNLFQCPPGFSRSMCKIVSQIVEREVSNQFLFAPYLLDV